MSHAFAVLAMVGIGIFLAAAIIGHWLRASDLDPFEAPLSKYVSDTTRSLLIAAYVALATSILMTAAASMTRQSRPLFVFAFAACYVLTAALLIPVALTTRRSIHRSDERSQLQIRTHRQASLICFSASTLGSLIYSVGLVSQGTRPVWAAPMLTISLMTCTLFIATFLHRGRLNGFIQKMLVVFLSAWILYCDALILAN
jgi:hypothetical protein